MESQTKIHELMARAREKEEAAKQQREQETQASAQAAISERSDKIYADREEQITRNEELGRLDEIKQADEHRVSVYKKELEDIGPQRKEVEGKIAAEDVAEDAKEIYGQILEELGKEEVRLTEELNQAQGELGGTIEATTANKEFISTSGKEAAEVLGYEGKERGQQLLDYVQQMRQFNKEASEASQEYNADQLADKIVDKVTKSQERRYGASSDDYIIDLRTSYDRVPQAFFENPVLANAVRQKLFEKDRSVVDAYHADSGNEDLRNQFEDMRKLSHAKVKVLYKDKESNQDKEAYVWEGNSNKYAYIDKGVRLPKLSYELNVSDNEQAMIDQAVKNPDVPIDQVKNQLGIKYDEEVLAKVQGDALKENETIDQARAKEKAIREAQLELQRAEVAVDNAKDSLEGYKAVGDYMQYMKDVFQPKTAEYSRMSDGPDIKALKGQLNTLQDQLRTEQGKTGLMAVGSKGRQEKLTSKIDPLKEQIQGLEDDADKFRNELNTELDEQRKRMQEKFRGDYLQVRIGNRSNRSFDATRPTDESIRAFQGEIPYLEQNLKSLEADVVTKREALEKLKA